MAETPRMSAEQAFMALLAEVRALRLSIHALIATIQEDRAQRQQQSTNRPKGLDGILDSLLGKEPK